MNNKKIEFGTGGFRGVIGDDFNKENIQLVAQAISNLVKEVKSNKPIVVGYDYRFLSEFASKWMCEVFAANGIESLLSNEPTPTPAVMYKTRHLDNDYGVMITASHNPYYFNGIKVFQKDGMDADVELTSRIEKIISEVKNVKTLDIDVAIKEGKVKVISFIKEYADSIKKWISPEVYGSNVEILYDNLHGVGVTSLSILKEELGLKNFEIIHSEHDAYFGDALPNPTKANMLNDAKYVTGDKHYACVFGIDSDGDRLGVLDEHGNYVDSNEILSCLYYYLVKVRGLKGDSVKNVATSNLLDKVTEKLGFKCHEVDVGFKNISSKIKETDALLGGESSGGLTVRGYLYGKDSSFALALFMEMMAIMKKPVSQIVKEVRDFAGFYHTCIESSISYKDEKRVLSYLDNETITFPEPVIRVEKLNRNIKYIFANDSWILLRRSGTEPVLRIFVEMESKEKAEKYLQILNDYVKNIDSLIGV